MRETIFQTDWGWVGLAATDQGVRAVVLPKTTRRAVERALRESGINGEAASNGAGRTESHLEAARSAVAAYLEGNMRDFNLPLDLQGQPRFCVKVWKVLQRDRKSTRLNSSHVRISYAVFCLKKKRKACRQPL